jgi:hypothetical protein
MKGEKFDRNRRGGSSISVGITGGRMVGMTEIDARRHEKGTMGGINVSF